MTPFTQKTLPLVLTSTGYSAFKCSYSTDETSVKPKLFLMINMSLGKVSCCKKAA